MPPNGSEHVYVITRDPNIKILVKICEKTINKSL